MTAAFPPPPQTGHVDFPHPAFAWHLFWSIHHAPVIWFPMAASLFSKGICSVMGFLQSVPLPSESALPCQGPFAPRALPRFIATTSLSDSLASNLQLIVSLPVLLRRRNRRQGSPSLPNPTFPARCPLSPRRAPALRSNVSSHRMIGFNPSGSLAALIFGLTRPIRVRLRYGSQVRSRELQHGNYSPRCPFHYMLDVQFA
jgi:hypothetical protein